MKVKVFSATMVADREQLGAHITEFASTHTVHSIELLQSSDAAFHCTAAGLTYTDGGRGIFHAGRWWGRVALYSVTRARGRDEMGDYIPDLIPGEHHLEWRLTSDEEFHCLSCWVFSDPIAEKPKDKAR